MASNRKKVNGEPYKVEGRPTVMTPEALRKLEEAFALGCTDEEACFYANIGKSTMYDYQQNNPKFLERKDELKERPFLKARQTIVKSLDQAEHAKWYMERKKKSEFAQRTESTGAGGKDLPTPLLATMMVEKKEELDDDIE